MWITLTERDVAWATKIGQRRHAEALRMKLADKHGFRGQDGEQIHIAGACGELACAKALNIAWDATVNTFKHGGDLGDLQVRTRSRPEYDLIVRPDDYDEDIFILVLGTNPYHVVGWISGEDAKQPQWRQAYGNRPAAYFVPQSELRPLGELTWQTTTR